MSLKNLIKENLVLTIGLSLPVLLIVLFFAATVIPRSLATPPQYELLFSYTKYQYNAPPAYNTSFVVRDGALVAVLTENRKDAMNYNTSHLMIYDGKTESVREITPDLPAKPTLIDGRAEIAVAEAKGMKIDTGSKSPDGYAFDCGGYGRGGIAAEVFVGGYSRNSCSIRKGAAAFKLRLPNDNGYYYSYYNGLNFIGWIVEKK